MLLWTLFSPQGLSLAADGARNDAARSFVSGVAGLVPVDVATRAGGTLLRDVDIAGFTLA
jgi:hypothetical protein